MTVLRFIPTPILRYGAGLLATFKVKNLRVLFMAEAQNTRRKLPWIKNPDLSADNFLDALKTHIKNPEDQERLWFVRLRVADEVEVPSCIAKNSEGSRANGVFEWQGVCDAPGRSLYLSISKLPNSAKFILRKLESRSTNHRVVT